MEPGRPTSLTPEVQEAICAYIRDGTPRKFATLAAGVSERSFRHWMARGRAARPGDEVFVAFLAAVKKAAAEAVAAKVAVLRRAESDSWQAAAWWLERCHPEHFGLNRKELRELIRDVADWKRQRDAANQRPAPGRGRPEEQPPADEPIHRVPG